MAELERLGATGEWGDLLVRLLRLQGWTVVRRPRLGGGVLLIAARGNLHAGGAGDSMAEASIALFERAARAPWLAAA